MKCPSCEHPLSKVTDSRPAQLGNSIRRRRECFGCGHRFTTYEGPEPWEKQTYPGESEDPAPPASVVWRGSVVAKLVPIDLWEAMCSKLGIDASSWEDLDEHLTALDEEDDGGQEDL